ncbi:20874_t:CDS:2, partial [Rhizophagus irregularis]
LSRKLLLQCQSQLVFRPSKGSEIRPPIEYRLLDVSEQSRKGCPSKLYNNIPIAYEKPADEESGSTGKKSPEKANEESDYMNIDDSYRSLLDVMEEVPVNTRNVLKEESSDFKGFDVSTTLSIVGVDIADGNLLSSSAWAVDYIL